MSYQNMPKLHLQFIFEFIILMFCPLPFYEKWVTQSFLTNEEQGGTSRTLSRFMSDYFFLAMFFRFIFFLRTAFDYSIYNDEYSKKICRHHNVSSGIRFTFKCFLNKYPVWTVFWLFFITILGISYMLRILELPFLLYETKNSPNDTLTFYE